MPISRSSLTECWVGLVFSSPAVGMYGRSVRCMKQTLLRPSSMPIWRMASRKGRDSMSPTVPPTSTMASTSAPGAGLDLALDLVGDGDDLHGFAQVLAAALLPQHRVRDGRW